MPTEWVGRAVRIDARHDKGHVLLFGNNPVWRGETIGGCRMSFNAITHYDRL